jgi:AcrR family transcriptional regulator
MPTRVVAHGHVVRVAERMFDATASVDMDVLAREVGVSRATLYRVVGSRERILGDVLWWQGQQVMGYAARRVTAAGAERLVQLARTFNERLIGYQPLRTFLRAEPVLAHHVLFLPEARVHSRFVALWRDLFVEAAAREEIRLPFDVDELAFLWVRTGESMLYADLMSGLEPRVELAERVQRLLLVADSVPLTSVPGQASRAL